MSASVNDQRVRRASIVRNTSETRVEVEVDLDGASHGGSAEISVETGIGFLDHLFTALARHGGLGLRLRCAGDLHIDDHHSAEDCALTLGKAISEALGERAGFARFGYAYAPLDEALARAVVDVSGRPFGRARLRLSRGSVGALACENISHVITSLATGMNATIHVDVLRGENDHHKAEAAFKALALALRMALTRTQAQGVPSTKGVL
jgi:imidazoleglycerol-phosphate dehydratase